MGNCLALGVGNYLTFDTWHALPDGWTDMEYWDFIEARRRLIAKVIREGHECLVSKATARHKVDDHATEVTLTP